MRFKTKQFKELQNNSEYYDSFLVLQKKNNYFTSKKNGFLAYRKINKDLFIVGGLISPNKKELLKEFQIFCNKNKIKNYCFVGIKNSDLNLFSKNHCVNPFEQEALIYPQQKTHYSHSLNHAINKSKKELIFKELNHFQILDRLYEINYISKQWQGNKKELEFILETFNLDHLKQKRFFCALNKKTNRIEGYIICNPNYGKNSYETDIFRRKKNCNKNTMEFLVFNIIKRFESENIKEFSLSNVVGKIPTVKKVTKFKSSMMAHFILKQTYKQKNIIFNSRNLALFKDKFKPTWKTRYIVFKKKPTAITIYHFFKAMNKI